MEYKTKLENLLREQCESIIAMIQVNVLKKKSNDEMKAFFTKLVGDNYRYIAEMSSGERRAKAVEDARQNYEAAQMVELLGCSPIKLSINLNLAVFYYEVTHNLPKA